MSDNRILGIIPARKGSKRVPQKNFRPFGGATLVDLAIQQALSSKLLTKVVVNSDAEEVLEIASKYSSITSIKRPTELSGDESLAIEYMIQTLDELQKAGEIYDLVVIIQPSSPLRSGNDLDGTIRLLIEDAGADSAVSVVQVPHVLHPHKFKRMNGLVLEPWLVDEGQQTAAHELPDVYVRNCAVYVFRVKNLYERITYGDKSLGYLMPADTSIDINDMLDFEFAEYLMIKNKYL